MDINLKYRISLDCLNLVTLFHASIPILIVDRSMTSIIRIKYTGLVDSDKVHSNMQLEGTEKELLINIDCPLKLILNYIRNAVNLENTTEFDLCDEISCQLRKVSFFEPRTSGLDIFDVDLTYLIVIHQRDSNGQMINFTPLLTGKSAKRCTDILLKNHTSHRKGSSVKSTLKIKP